jgi:polyvinyl alcohol dehydrogenase (cytochrome)
MRSSNRVSCGLAAFVLFASPLGAGCDRPASSRALDSAAWAADDTGVSNEADGAGMDVEGDAAGPMLDGSPTLDGSPEPDAGRAAAPSALDPADWPMALHDVLASGHNPSEDALDPRNVDRLEVKWRFDSSVAGHEVGPIHATPVVANDTVYVGSATGRFYAIARDGKLLWQYQTRPADALPASVKATPVGAAIYAGAASIIGGAALAATRPYVIFGDITGNLYALDRQTGKEVWVREDADGHALSGVGGNSLLLVGETLFVGFASAEMLALNNLGSDVWQCCSFRGSVAAFDVATGAEKWRFYTVPPAAGLPEQRAPYLVGPSGGSIWGQPSYDAATNTVFVGTGSNFSPTATGGSTELTDSIIALDAASGALKWSYQATKNDIWSEGEFNPRTDGEYLDADFGDSPKLYDLPGIGKVIGVQGHRRRPEERSLLCPRRARRRARTSHRTLEDVHDAGRFSESGRLRRRHRLRARARPHRRTWPAHRG